MILNPKMILKEGVLVPVNKEFLIDENIQCQQNGIDLRIGKVFEMLNLSHKSESLKLISPCGDSKIFPYTSPIGNFCKEKNREIFLFANKTYSIETLEYVKLTKDISSMFILRSSFSRCGVFSTNGWWDSGFEGLVATTIRPSFDMKIILGDRIGQMIFFHSDSAQLYNGSYQGLTVNVPKNS